MVSSTWENPALIERWSQGARTAFETKYTEEANYETLMEIYEQANGCAKHARRDW